MARYMDADAFEVVGMKDVSDEFAAGVQFMLEQLDKAQTIEARPVVRGEWKAIEDKLWNLDFPVVVGYECSECRTWGHDEYNFCPNCGADMRGEEVDRD